MSEPKHSPLPWTHGLDLDPSDSGIEAAGGGCVAHIQCHGNLNTIRRTGEDFSHADAEFIVRACNSHYDLLAALIEAEKMLVTAMREDLDFGPRITEKVIAGHEGMKQIRAAIAKANAPTSSEGK